MANSYFPQLTSGAMAQYPLRRQTEVRTIKNILPDGRMILLPDSSGGRRRWQLAYTNLSVDDVQALATHFRSCSGALSSFTFLDPADNLFTNSLDLTASCWNTNSLIQVASEGLGPLEGSPAFEVTNTAQSNLDFGQTLSIPTYYSYALSLYARSASATSVTLFLKGASTSVTSLQAVGAGWSRLTLSGKLTEQAAELTAGITLIPGQELSIFGLQLEAQPVMSAYKPTSSRSGVYPQAHWAMEEFGATATGPNQFSAVAIVESAV